MAKNDLKIKDLLKVIETKEDALGIKPRASWKTNGIFICPNGNSTNVNTIGTIEKCLDVVAIILREHSFKIEAAEQLGVSCDSIAAYRGFSFEDWVHDFKLRASMITWDMEKKKLNILDKKLKDLRSEDAKTEDAISSIMKDLEK